MCGHRNENDRSAECITLALTDLVWPTQQFLLPSVCKQSHLSWITMEPLSAARHFIRVHARGHGLPEILFMSLDHTVLIMVEKLGEVDERGTVC